MMKPRPQLLGPRVIERPSWVEASLWRRLRFESQDDCRQTIFTRYHELARGIAGAEFRRRPSYGLERADFEQLAYRGLLEAIDRYDPLRGSPFGAFVSPRIRGAIADALARSSDEGARYSERRRLERERLNSLAPTPDEAANDPISALTDIAVGLALGLLVEGAAAIDGTPMESTDFSGYHTLEWRQMQVAVIEEIGRLPETERVVLQQHYLNGIAFSLIADMMSLSKSRVSQLHKTALQNIRARLRTRQGEDT